MTDKPKSNRRDFLKFRSAIDALRGQVDDSTGQGEKTDLSKKASAFETRQANYLEQYSKNAMACEFELLFNLHQYRESGPAAMQAFQLIDLLEDRMTVYRDHSEISQLNAAAFEDPILVEHRLFELLHSAKIIHEQTSGAFDMTAAPLSKAWGFYQRQGGVPDQASIDEAMALVGSEFVELDHRTEKVSFTRQGVAINLGGIGKGHALDRVAELLDDNGVGDFVIHGGQSSVLARGSSTVERPKVGADLVESKRSALDENPGDGQPNSRGWKVGITHPTLPGVRIAEVTLINQALGTSGTGRQGFFHQGKRYGHIIDPRTGWPTDHLLSTTVISDSAATSDALATAFFVMTVDEIEDYCETHPEICAILILSDSRSGAATGTRIQRNDASSKSILNETENESGNQSGTKRTGRVRVVCLNLDESQICWFDDSSVLPGS